MDVTERSDLNKHLGKWYEIARFDYRFGRNQEQATAYYFFCPEGWLFK